MEYSKNFSEKICSEISLIFPTKNDEIKILDEFDNIFNFCRSRFDKFEIIVVSNGSKEENIEALKSKLEKHESTIYKIYENSGKGFAVREGIKAANYKFNLIMDSDFSVKIDNIDKLFSSKDNPRGDFTVGSRKLIDSSVLNTPKLRILSGSIYMYLVKLLFGIPVSDTQCGFKLINREKFKNITYFKSNEFSYDVELFILADMLNLTVYEIPVEYNHNEESNVSLIKDSTLMFLKLIYFRLKYLN